ncbi:hypothetical protein VRU48_14825 [Pedobacter sp. KR3-3]|uniref:Uncharacterized protein n=1 Tax=Pedobacter albus TaxID=3113905 RepID=A0ABU7IA89_9SPHI|nr:hypothetical protein [Pedobacter sp. KR3-3]MEE1946395.1 hypothetical protein [Pedobacter sp. KR3-3]
MTPGQIESYLKVAEDGSIPDEQNPLFVFSLTHPYLLAKLAYGEIDPVQFAKRELAQRGLDREGKWIGFGEAEKLHFPTGIKTKPRIQKRYGKRR